jgi:predicted enzyme related to lactoylglutathione lyase
MGRAVHFEIHASNPQQLVDFYADLFGWSFHKWEGAEYWLISTGDKEKPGVDGGLVQRRGPAAVEGAAVNAFVVTVDVADLDGDLAKAMASGGSMAVPKMPIPGVGWLAYIKDPDGNILGMMQADQRAA